MLEKFKHVEKIFNRHHVRCEQGNIEFVEKKRGGECTAIFQVTNPCLRLVPDRDQHPIKWLNNQQCADGAFITEVNGRPFIHIVELKSRVGIEDWSSIVNQFCGMFWNVVAVLAIIGVNEIEGVACHLVYSSDEVRLDRTASPTLLRYMPEKYISVADDWRNYRVSLPRGILAPLDRRLRPADRRVDFGVIPR